MEGIGNIHSCRPEVDNTPARGMILAFAVMFITSGLPYFLSSVNRVLPWIAWAALIWALYKFSREFPLARLFRPILPYLLWLIFFLTWGLIVSPITNIAYAGKTVVTTILLALAVAILTATRSHLRTFANMIQLTVVVNLAFWFVMLLSPNAAHIVLEAVDPRFPARFMDLHRYGGLYGNANMMGYVCLVALMLSVLATPWFAWVGRLCALPLLYLTVSRKSTILFLLILFLYALMVKRRNVKFWIASFAVACLSVLAFLLSSGLRQTAQAASENPTITRLLDVQEKRTQEVGDVTRVGLLRQWLSALHDAPWYGYGLQSMSGRVYDEKNPQKVLVRGPYEVGSHNTYLGVLVEVGPVGFIAFLLMLLHYARLCLVSGREPHVRWLLISFMLVNYVFLVVSHNHLFCFEGQTAFTLLFLLSSSHGLLQRVQGRTGSSDPLYS